MEISRERIEQIIAGVLAEKLSGTRQDFPDAYKQRAGNVLKVNVPNIRVQPEDQLDTGNVRDQVYTHDVFSLLESPRLGCGIMEMEKTTFDWTLNYDEIDYIIEGSLTIIIDGKSVTAGAGEIILIPKGSKIQFSVPQSARFLYVTYPADWMEQG